MARASSDWLVRISNSPVATLTAIKPGGARRYTAERSCAVVAAWRATRTFHGLGHVQDSIVLGTEVQPERPPADRGDDAYLVAAVAVASDRHDVAISCSGIQHAISAHGDALRANQLT